ncbi:hypothetical protein SISNIDRAFT_447215 [Sistotremastrum niveocremeum HHB9708]|uniref:EF-hand domain-containing protein n=1 Tax=Sistotremastrum niveocremeum HHB9708 TaxID=1314777 RepID=A0A164MT40_9AGAM|nr:hypothetical protein SISNIDRAFT_447215 [Sistotremastrum niveocremeum HHB9708]
MDEVDRLPPRTLRRIDRAFQLALSECETQDKDGSRPNKRRKVTVSPPPIGDGGGFMVEDDDEQQQGGFVNDDVDEESSHTISPESIPLSMIPRALQILDLPPDDDEILSVFQNAATGWGTELNGPQYVSHKDWRAVCAVLLHVEADQASVVPDSSSPGGFMPEDDEDSGEDWQKNAEDSFPSSDPDDDEYVLESQPRPSTSKRRERATKRRASRASSDESDDEEEDEPKGPTPRQKRESRKAFALFFPDVSEKDLDLQQIKIKDVDRVAKMLNEKLKADDIVEMLEYFSSTSDKSVGLADFEKMMITARLV